ncbi:MAG: hypothetical protein LBE09_09480, partial [Christensenellaceae bacterium]|nr:hypothetical protein [Christensenellaceae bacterium]
MTKPKTIFNGKPISVEFMEKQSEWIFSVVDVLSTIVQHTIPRNYWRNLKRVLIQENNPLLKKIVQLKMVSLKDGKTYKTDYLNKEWTLALLSRLKIGIDYESFFEWINQFERKNRKL